MRYYVIKNDELYHHGVLGQKWGVRRYQNYDGTRTAEGKRRRNNTNTDSLKKMLDNGDILTTNKLYGLERDIHKGTNQSNPIVKRANKDADLGLKALAKMGYDAFDKDEGITNDDRWWFMFEDQTYGCLAIADMVNQGKTKKQILDLLNQVNVDESSNDGMFELNEFNSSGAYKTNYIDECINVKNSELKKQR